MKKWTFLVASAMLVGATPVFTGCIDNDEPEGISVLRGAKAELLRAKVAVEQANAISIKADAVLKEAQAKVQEALAANELAKAKILEAQAKQEEAKVELIKTQNEQEKARLEEQIKEYERVQKEWQAEMDRNATEAEQAIKEWELSYKEAQVAYEKVLVELATAKATLTAKQNKILEPLITAVEEKKSFYDTKVEDVRELQAKILLLSKHVEEKASQKEYYTRELKWNLKKAELDLAASKEKQEYVNKELEDAKAMQPSELAVKEKALRDEYQQATLALSDAKLAAAEKRHEMQDQFDALDEAIAAAEAMQTNEITIPEFTYEFPNIGIPNIQGKQKVNDELKYTLAESDMYGYVQADYKYWIGELKNIFCDPNKEAWTKEKVAELKAKLTALNKQTIETQGYWQEAVDAYKTQTENADPSKFTGYAELSTAIDDYNAVAEKYNVALAAYKEAFDKVDQNAAYERYMEAMNAADEKLQSVNDAAQAEYQSTISDYTHELDNLLADKQLRKVEYEKALHASLADPKDEALKKAADEASKVLETVTKACEDKQKEWTEIIKKAQEKLDKQNVAAADICKVDQATAYKEYKATLTDKTLIANLETAKNNLETAKKTTGDALQVVYEAYIVYDWHTYYSATKNFYLITSARLSLNHKVEALMLEVEKVAAINKETIASVVIYYSNRLYGDFEDNDRLPRLVALSKDEIKKIIADKFPEVEPWFLFYYYSDFGLVGYEMYLEAVIEFAQAYIDNPTAVNTAVAEFEKRLETLNKTYQDALEAYTAAVEANELTKAKLDEALQPSLEEIIKKQNAIQPVYMMWKAVHDAIYEHWENDDIVYTERMIKHIVSRLEREVSICEKEVYDAETLVMKRTKQLEEWNKGDLRMMDLADTLLKEAEAKAAVAKENLDIAQAALEDAIAKMAVDSERFE